MGGLGGSSPFCPLTHSTPFLNTESDIAAPHQQHYRRGRRQSPCRRAETARGEKTADVSVVYYIHFYQQKLTELGISGNRIDVEGARALADALRRHEVKESPPSCQITHYTPLSEQGLTTLEIDNNNIGVDGARVLANALTHHKVRIASVSYVHQRDFLSSRRVSDP